MKDGNEGRKEGRTFGFDERRRRLKAGVKV
jgi:hypothetical protein